MRSCERCALSGLVAAGALLLVGQVAQAGGFAVREQSASSQGSSFAGSAAGYDLSSGFWNPAAFGIAGWGITTESNYALIIPSSDLDATSATLVVPGPAIVPVPGSSSTDIGMLALVPASYGAYRLSKDLVLGISINSPFGLATKPDDATWQGRYVGTTSKMFTLNASPTLSYQLAPGLFVGAGVQFEYMSLLFQVRFSVGGHCHSRCQRQPRRRLHRRSALATHQVDQRRPRLSILRFDHDLKGRFGSSRCLDVRRRQGNLQDSGNRDLEL